MINKPSDDDAEMAIKVLISWMGDDPNREGLLNTPKRVLNFYRKMFEGYQYNPQDISIADELSNFCNYTDLIILKNISFTSYCEHHIVPMKGNINIGYLPNESICGVGKMIKLLNIFVKRLQMQEKLTVQIAEFLNNFLLPKGVAVLIKATHECIACYGEYYNNNLILQTHCMLGIFQHDVNIRKEFFDQVIK
ncbi:GTP cyclohydrolase I [Neoehrlichia mikurensis]|uniref:GTP cyclohydrolase 1 n=1 Tax=Neoehrlichia mikurensis TaxID=89586 RepID=A0A9Q9BZM7_9RICK|nr:GTP cyclohydrolase I [Neoehrlichia mikurensis]QXK91956.1 GTP cyclohydrolase I [Neoehrlichia mikurensis]QXK93169.1 GTP cyclohydrolase I [Neoehrlichia mikurensis]QXK93648.1 GTP cyclohydrolase I [Neoehrlichia mikurensis]UTO55395.1 GTP cyclohydrolase I [Neoehrlichia mikurensis]UTO56314.1 GTP cyclohydrolase I [Neoehrlichia mikurensis]